ncbi:sensor histidine kinase [Kribbella deserti]|uniref:histidine kinase n=1 Tax=Kribbella deserti TaxID=1926257 RepID=A0ABV6QV13_9ACTN
MERLRRWYAWFRRHGPRLRDLIFIGFSLLYTLAQAMSQGGAQSSITFVVGIAASLALWWRRKYPVAVTFVAIVAQATTMVFAPLGFALFTLAIRRRDTVLALTSLAAYAAYVLGYGPENGRNELAVLFVTGPFVVGLWVAAGAYIGARRDLMASLRDRAERAESERELRAEQARLGERARIAQEMHDVLAHKVSLIALHAGGLEVNPGVGPEKVESSAGLIRETARQAMEDLREVLGVLRTDVSADGADLAPVPAATDLSRLVDASRAAGVNVSARIELPAEVPAALGRTVYRIVQESLTNVHKHARGAATEVLVTPERQQIVVRVANLRPVASGALLPGSGAGLVGLRERVNLVGGALMAGPTVDGGWQVEARLPWTPAPPDPSAAPADPTAAQTGPAAAPEHGEAAADRPDETEGENKVAQ